MTKPHNPFACFASSTSPQAIGAAWEAVQAIWPAHIPATWQRRGTWLETWHNDRRIASAPRLCYTALYFQDQEVVPTYHALGGTCDSGKVCIRLPHKAAWDAAPLQKLLCLILQ